MQNEYWLLRWNSFIGKSFRGRVKHGDLGHDAIRPFVISPDYLLVGNFGSRKSGKKAVHALVQKMLTGDVVEPGLIAFSALNRVT